MRKYFPLDLSRFSPFITNHYRSKVEGQRHCLTTTSWYAIQHVYRNINVILKNKCIFLIPNPISLLFSRIVGLGLFTETILTLVFITYYIIYTVVGHFFVVRETILRFQKRYISFSIQTFWTFWRKLSHLQDTHKHTHTPPHTHTHPHAHARTHTHTHKIKK